MVDHQDHAVGMRRVSRLDPVTVVLQDSLNGRRDQLGGFQRLIRLWRVAGSGAPGGGEQR